jgi:transcriptional regulator with XRE-family HTH domain
VLAGQELKNLRHKRNITVRKVEQASRRIADVKGDKQFCISNGWLAQLENGVSKPSSSKLFSLSVIYHVNFWDLLRLYNIDVADKQKYEPVADPYLTQLLSDDKNDCSGVFPSHDSQGTSLLPNHNGEEHNIIYGHLGWADLTMFPMIRPGALLKIDTSQNKLTSGEWRNEYERPIFFIELRDAYACGWCEVHSNQLLIIPHHSSPARVRRFTYPREAEIAGRVIGYSTRCIDANESVA